MFVQNSLGFKFQSLMIRVVLSSWKGHLLLWGFYLLLLGRKRDTRAPFLYLMKFFKWFQPKIIFMATWHVLGWHVLLPFIINSKNIIGAITERPLFFVIFTQASLLSCCSVGLGWPFPSPLHSPCPLQWLKAPFGCITSLAFHKSALVIIFVFQIKKWGFKRLDLLKVR